MIQVGLHLTKNNTKYIELKNRLISQLDNPKKLNFIHLSSENDIKTHIHKLDILHCYEIKSDFFSHASPNLKWIQIGAAGIEKSLLDAVLKSKVIITNASGIHASPVSEYVISSMLFFSKMFRDFEVFKNTKKWTQWDIAKKIVELKGQTIGIIGYGSIGKDIAKKAKAFGMNVIATRRLQKKVESNKFVDQLIPTSDLKVLLKNSDYVVISCPLTPLTTNLISLKELKLMKENAIIINIARGQIINQDDLINALENKIISGAALDVFAKEPLEESSKLFDLDNVIISPHISGNYPNYQKDMVDQFADNLNRFILGKALKNRVCKKRLY
tara:strand:+ start:7461 stop:8447 length:987 start_codon:yes stop_codon:yes gene_type:complete